MSYENPRTQLGQRPEQILISGDTFAFVRGQRGDASAVYKSADAFMRIGNPAKILKDLAIHKSMEDAGFPVAKLIAEGELGDQAYFVEASLGHEHMGELFAHDTETQGSISTERFSDFASLAETYAHAQLSTGTGEISSLKKGILLDDLCEELPEYADKLRARYEIVEENTKGLPNVLTHGDFNPNNLYPKGVIDLEDSFYAPYGYDLISAITHINYFPDSKEYEYFAKYRFTPSQQEEYLNRLDAISIEAELPPVSSFYDDLEFCRAVWLAAKIPHVPKLQKFRYDLLVEKFLT